MASVMEIGTGEFYIAQGGYFERAVKEEAVGGSKGDGLTEVSAFFDALGVGEGAEGGFGSEGEIFEGGSDADIGEAGIEDEFSGRGSDFGYEVKLGTLSDVLHGGDGKFGTTVAGDTFPFVDEEFEAAFGGGIDGVFITGGIAIVRGLVANQGRLVHHDGEAPVEGEVGFHLGVSIFGWLVRIPPDIVEGAADEALVVDTDHAFAGWIGEATEDAILDKDLLFGQWFEAEHFPAKIFESALAPDHFGVAQLGTERLRCERGVIEEDANGGHGIGFGGDGDGDPDPPTVVEPGVPLLLPLDGGGGLLSIFEDASGWVEFAERVRAIEEVAGFSIVGETIVEDRVQIGWSIAAGDLAGVGATEFEDRIRDGSGFFFGEPVDHFKEFFLGDTLGSDDFFGVVEDGIAIDGGEGIFEAVEGEVVDGEGLVGAAELGGGFIAEGDLGWGGRAEGAA